MNIRALLVVALCVLVVACTGGSDIVAPEPIESPVAPWERPEDDASPEAESPTPLETIPPGEQRDLRLLGPDGAQASFSVEVVADPASRQQGLMHRTELAPDAGMLFLFPGENTGGFWMRNTLIPLSIAFLAADGAIVAIMDMEPCEADPCPTHAPETSYTAALEVNRSAFDAAGVTTDWRVELDEDLPDPR